MCHTVIQAHVGILGAILNPFQSAYIIFLKTFHRNKGIYGIIVSAYLHVIYSSKRTQFSIIDKPINMCMLYILLAGCFYDIEKYRFKSKSAYYSDLPIALSSV